MSSSIVGAINGICHLRYGVNIAFALLIQALLMSLVGQQEHVAGSHF